MISQTMTEDKAQHIQDMIAEQLFDARGCLTPSVYINIIERALNRAGYVITEADDGK